MADSENRLQIGAEWLLGIAGFLLTYAGLVVLVWSAAKPITRLAVSGGTRSELVINAAITLFAVAMIRLLAFGSRRVKKDSGQTG